MILSSFTAETNLNGPEPIGCASNADCPTLSITCFGTIFTQVKRLANKANGYFSLNSTTLSSTAFTLSTKSINITNSDLLAGSIIRLKEYTTSSVVTGAPSWKVAPSRKVIRHVVSSTCSGSFPAKAR